MAKRFGRERTGSLLACSALLLGLGISNAQTQPKEFMGYQAPVRTLRQPGEIRTLGGPRQGEALAIALDFFRAKTTDLGLTAADLADLHVARSYRSRHNGVTHVYLVQRFEGIEVQNAYATINVLPDGSILNLACTFIPGLKQSVQETQPELDALEALDFGTQYLGLQFLQEVRQVESLGGPERKLRLSDGGLAAQPIEGRLVYVPIASDQVRLAWLISIDHKKDGHWWNIAVDARNGAVRSLSDWVEYDSYNVFALPAESPNHTLPVSTRTLVSNPAHSVASPFGWHDTNGVAGAEFTITRGNNVHAYTDSNNDNQPDPNSSPEGGPTLSFNFGLDLAQAPSAYAQAAVTNLFYMTNTLHDLFYVYGFDEASGNFQVNNYGRGGLANDDLNAEAQDSGDSNNALFTSSQDGNKVRMQMYLWSRTNPFRDADLDNGIIAHEYGHGVSQ